MELLDALRTTGSIRAFTDEPVGDGALRRILDTARFAPNGGNAQGWRVVVVKDPATRRALRDIYVAGWYEYIAMGMGGLRPWAPPNDRDAEAAAIEAHREAAPAVSSGRGGFAEHLDAVPALLAVVADLKALAAVDRDLPRYTFAGGASVYPFVWSLLLAAREEGLGGVITTMVIRREDEVRSLLGVPDDHAVAALVALGRPVHQPTKLTRAPVDSFTTVDRVDGPSLGS
jgi:nitroreductase